MTPRELRAQRYQEWLTAQSLLYGFDLEIAAQALRRNKGVLNDVPPVELWHQIVPTVRVLEKVRERFGATSILSAYRAPAYNAAVGGEDQSLHMQNRALDFRCATGTPAEWADYLFSLRDTGIFRGGVGTYQGQGFVHVDTRGTNATWSG